MKKRKWTSEAKAAIVLSGLKGLPISTICNEHGIAQSQYYAWRDQFLNNARKVFETEKISQDQHRILLENQRLKTLVGELTIELKKNDGDWL